MSVVLRPDQASTMRLEQAMDAVEPVGLIEWVAQRRQLNPENH